MMLMPLTQVMNIAPCDRLLDGFTVLFQKSGKTALAEDIENLFYNAAQERKPDQSSIAYLKTDNSFEMLGTKNGEIEPDGMQTRYKYSPVHQEVAVCCSPNAGRISPYFFTRLLVFWKVKILWWPHFWVRICWKQAMGNVPVKIEVDTEYPYQNKFKVHLFFKKGNSPEVKNT
ncbi:MAG: hypothetical protein MZV63_05980 [Marinilabiliales bacterium]|nr:hypothetical protein [Marinilabiliales bacterium]